MVAQLRGCFKAGVVGPLGLTFVFIGWCDCVYCKCFVYSVCNYL